MNEAFARGFDLLLGGVLGAIFFGGLWWTVGKAVGSKAPAIWVLASLIVRMALSLTGFYEISKGGLDRLFFCVGGFLLARQVVMRLSRPREGLGPYERRAATHAP